MSFGDYLALYITVAVLLGIGVAAYALHEMVMVALERTILLIVDIVRSIS